MTSDVTARASDASTLEALQRTVERQEIELARQAATLSAYAHSATLLQALSSELGRALSGRDVADIVAARGQELFGATASLVYFRQGDMLTLAAIAGLPIERANDYLQMPLALHQPGPDAVRTQAPIILGTRAELLASYPGLADVQHDGALLQAVVALPLRDEGHTVGGLAFSFYQPTTIDDARRNVFLMVAEQAAQAIRRARLFEAEARARATLQRRQERTAIVVEAATILASTRDSRQALKDLTQILVPALADWCAIDERSADGSPRRLSVYHRDPAMRALAASLAEKYPDVRDSPHGVYEVFRTGRRQWIEVITEAMVVAGARDPEHLAIVTALQLTSFAIVPMVVRGVVVGALTLVGERDRHISEEDLVAAEELGRHAALALENARLFEAAQHERTRMAALVEATATVVWSGGPNGEIVEPSRSWLAFTGQTAQQYIEGGYLEAIHPDDRAQTLQLWQDAVSERLPFAAEYRLRRRNGDYAYTLARGMPVFGPAGDVTEYIGCNVDITPQRHAERAASAHAETLATLNEIGRLISAELDQRKLVQAVTDAATALTQAEFGAVFYNVFDDHGAKAGEGAQGSFQLYTISGVDRDAFAKFPRPRNTAVFAPTFAGTGVVRSDDITQDPRYGHSAPHHGMPEGHLPVRSYLAVPIVSRSGEVIGGIFLGHGLPAVFDDRAETLAAGLAAQAAVAIDNARLYGEAQRLIRALEQSNRDLDQFAYVASHDLKAPLRGIASLSEFIGEDLGPDLSDDMKTNMALLRGRVRRMEALINGILDYSRVSRRGNTQREVVDVGRLLREIVELIIPKAPHRVVISGGMPSLNTERTMLQQVFMNLVGNALKHGGRPDVRIEITATELAHAWEFSVADDGVGIPAAYRERIWGLFQTLANRDTVESTGIGLAIVKKIVEARGGTVRVESELGLGTTFHFTWAKDEAAAPALS